MSPKPIRMSSGAEEKFFTDNGWTLDSQAQVTRGIRKLFFSNDPMAQIRFQKYHSSTFEEAGWEIPDFAKDSFALQTKTYDELSADSSRSSMLGYAPISVLYNMDLDEAIQRFSPGWRLEKLASNAGDLILDANGDPVLSIFRDPRNGNYESIFSPLSPNSLRHSLLWMPSYIQDDFRYLLGLPDMNAEDTQRFVRSRIEWEEINGKQKSAEPLCLSHTEDDTLRGAQSVTEAIVSQCDPDGRDIGYPSFGIATAASSDPVLHTRHQSSCIVIMVYDRASQMGLLLHITTADSTSGRQEHNYILESVFDHACHIKRRFGSPMSCYSEDGWENALGYFDESRFRPCACLETYPLEWYASVFRNVYFRDSSDSDIEVTVLSNVATPRGAVQDAGTAFKRYFPYADIREAFSSDLNMDVNVSSWLDTRNGDIYITNRWGRGNDLQNAMLFTSFKNQW